MTKTELYEVALQKMASEGNEAAKMVLELGSKTKPCSNNRAVLESLQDAVKHCGKALSENGYHWTRATDYAINDAIGSITSAISKLGGES